MKHTIIHLMFGILWMMLLLQIVFMNTSAYSILTQCISKETLRVSADNESIITDYQRFASANSYLEFMLLYQQRMVNVHRHCMRMTGFLDSMNTCIAAAAGGYMDAAQRLKHPDDCRWQKAIFTNRQSVLAMLNRVDSLNEFFIRNTRPYDNRYYLRKELPSKWCEGGWNDQGNCREEMQWSFSHSTASAAIAMIAAIKQNVVLSEKMILEELRREGRVIDDSYERIFCFAIPEQSFVVPGQTNTAKIFLASYNMRVVPRFSCDEGHISNIENGIAIWKGSTKVAGQQRVTGIITVKNNAREVTVPWEFQYRNGPPYAGLQLDRMNYLYRGIQNPVTISSVDGYDVKDLSLYIPGALVTPVSPGKYSILVESSRVKKLNALIIHTDSKEKQDTIGGMSLIVKDLPLPVATIGPEIKRAITADELIQARTLSVISPDEDWPLPYTTVGFSFSFLKKGNNEMTGPIAITGADYAGNAQVQEFLKGAAKGDRVFFSDIKAAAPDGSIVSPASVNYLLR